MGYEISLLFSKGKENTEIITHCDEVDDMVSIIESKVDNHIKEGYILKGLKVTHNSEEIYCTRKSFYNE